MTTMSDESAKKIAESTIKKYANANRKVLIIVNNSDNTSAEVYGSMNGSGSVEAALGLVYELAGDNAEAIFKDAAKQAKQLKKAEAKDAKRKKNA